MIRNIHYFYYLEIDEGFRGLYLTYSAATYQMQSWKYRGKRNEVPVDNFTDLSCAKFVNKTQIHYVILGAIEI